MKRIIILPFKDGNVEDGLRRLIQLNPETLLLFPVMDLPEYKQSITKIIKDTQVKYHIFFTDSSEGIDDLLLHAEDITMCTNPLKEILREITSEDVLGVVWEDSIEAHLALHALEDLAIETWNVEDGLEAIQLDLDDSESDILYEEMQDALSTFIEAFATYITNGVLETLSKAVEERINEDLGKKDINPFDE